MEVGDADDDDDQESIYEESPKEPHLASRLVILY